VYCFQKLPYRRLISSVISQESNFPPDTTFYTSISWLPSEVDKNAKNVNDPVLNKIIRLHSVRAI